MKRILSLFLISIITGIFFYCDHPTEFKRDNPFDPDANLFGIYIKVPGADEAVGDSIEIAIYPEYASTKYILKSLQIYINDSLLVTSERIPYRYSGDISSVVQGNCIILCKAHCKDGRVDSDEVNIYHDSN